MTLNSAEVLDLPDAVTSAEVPLLSILDYPRAKLADWIHTNFNEPAFRSLQVFEWIYRQKILTPEHWTNISKKFRDDLVKSFKFSLPKTKERQISIDGTRKYLFEIGNGDLVESVMIKQPGRMTLCVSSQVGCAIGCKFCQTGTMGLKRNLSTHEIIGQVMSVIEDAKNFNDMFSNIVFMGMGEPLHNYENVTDALRILRDDLGLNLSARKITISTAGLVPAIKRFAEDDVDACLAVSLNATTNEIRSKIMPINKKYPLEELLKTLAEYPLKKRERITIEYVMLKGINDSSDDLKRLPKLLKGIEAKVNLIPYNFNSGLGFQSPDKELPQIWQRELNRHGLIATIRWSKGPDISAACGQLVTETSQRALKEKKGLTIFA
ncbi:MAG: 23S rRNA (adenine(2503)-C(2))-methyltransferase RlmN [bacterium]|nr:23S rRNA (adenine(2503)-C(2))-methyltransferase RlmN [bacterium]